MANWTDTAEHHAERRNAVRSEHLTARTLLLWVVLALIAPVVGYKLGYDDARHDLASVALCPNWDSLVIHPTPWERDHGRLVRVLVAPEPCRVGRDTVTP